jgi:hypothetical protein
MTGARRMAYVVVVLVGCQGEAGRPPASSVASAPSSTEQAPLAIAPSAPASVSEDGVGFGGENKMDKAIASMRRCKVDTDCVLVRVSCGAQAAVATASKDAAERAMLAECPSGGSGGWNPTIAPPKVGCPAGTCVVIY